MCLANLALFLRNTLHPAYYSSFLVNTILYNVLYTILYTVLYKNMYTVLYTVMSTLLYTILLILLYKDVKVAGLLV